MGFGTIAVNIILFIAVITITAGFVVLINMYAQETSSSLNIQKDRLMDELRTDITISEISYENSSEPGILTVYVQNTGKTDLVLNDTDLFVSGERIPRTSRTISIEEDTKRTVDAIWSPREVIKIVAEKNIDSGAHRIRVVSSNGISDEEFASIA